MSNSKQPSNLQVITFTIILSTICALILASLSSALAEPKLVARELDQSKQMLIAARILTHGGTFQIQNDKGELVPAKYAGNGLLEVGSLGDKATGEQVLEVYRKRIVPILVNAQGKKTTFKESGIDEQDYLHENQKSGFAHLPEKLLYEILPNGAQGEEAKPIGYVIPVNGFGLWDAIYGYIAVKTDGNTIIGISWYDQKETPGLGANIADAPWQSEFPGKHIFQGSATGSTDFKTAPIGITVVKGKVSEVLGDSPKALSAVDGMAGATLTGNGVTEAYKSVLNAYRPFFVLLQANPSDKEKTTESKEVS